MEPEGFTYFLGGEQIKKFENNSKKRLLPEHVEERKAQNGDMPDSKITLKTIQEAVNNNLERDEK